VANIRIKHVLVALATIQVLMLGAVLTLNLYFTWQMSEFFEAMRLMSGSTNF